MRRLLLLFILLFSGLLSPVTLHAAFVDPKLEWHTATTEHFRIHFYKGEEAIVQELLPIVEEVYQAQSEKFKFKAHWKTEIVVVDKDDLANGFATVIPYNMILLQVVPPTSDSTLADYKGDWLRELFVHEFTHIVHITDTGYPAKILKPVLGTLIAPNGLTPGWSTEGLATYFETVGTEGGRGRASFTEMLLRTDILNGNFAHLDQMTGTGYDWPGWMPQYLYGVKFWQYLSERFGEEKLLQWSHKMGSSLWFYSLNRQAKKVFKDEQGKGLSFYRLWADWKKSLEGRYAELFQKIRSEGQVDGETLLFPKEGERFSLPTISPDGKKIAYLSTSVHHQQELRVRELESGKEKIVLKKKNVHQVGFSPDGKKLITSYVDTFKKHYQYSDLHEIDLETKKSSQLTEGKRARDPDYSPDGNKIVAVVQEMGKASLSLFDPATKEWKSIFEASQMDHPRWLKDGQSIVVSAHREGRRDLWQVPLQGSAKRLTSSGEMDDQPVPSSEDASVIYFSSDSNDGITNIYRYNLNTHQRSQLTNVLTGAFNPTVLSDGVAFEYYNGKGYEIRKLDLSKALAPVVSGTRVADVTPSARSDSAAIVSEAAESRPANGRTDTPSANALLKSDKYSPFPRLLVPRFIVPSVSFIDGSLFLAATTINFDPLYRHFWSGDVTYRSDNGFIGYDFSYSYQRYRPSFTVGFSDFSVNFGDVFGLGNDFFEERRRAFGQVSWPVFSSQRLTLQYFFEDRSEESGLPAGVTLSTLGNYAGALARYSFGKTEGTAAQISPEGGGRGSINFSITDSTLGSSETLEQRLVWGDFRKFFLMPYAGHHVVALRAAGGKSFGDRLLQGNFGLGGSLGEGPFATTSTRLFTLRGLPLVTFSRDNAWVASAEYRFPLFRLQRGLGTLPVALNSAHMAFFADVGDAVNNFNPSFRPLTGVGAELRGDFIIGYHIPVQGRLGYGVIVTHRERITGLRDDITGADVRNGVLILELGTSF